MSIHIEHTIFIMLFLFSTSCGAKTGLMCMEGETCQPNRYVIRSSETQVYFVLDRSGSMEFPLDRSVSTLTKWSLLLEGLEEVIASMDEDLILGFKLFPDLDAPCEMSRTPEACNVSHELDHISRSSETFRFLSRLWSIEPCGPTPLRNALTTIGDHLSETNSWNSFAIVILTDGVPTCAADYEEGEDEQDIEGTIAEIERLENRGAPSYIIAVRGESIFSSEVLEQMAHAGGRPRDGSEESYYSVDEPEDFEGVLDEIIETIRNCELQVPSGYSQPELVTVHIGDSLIPYDPSHQNGWDWMHTLEGRLVIYGDACTNARETDDEIIIHTRCDEGEGQPREVSCEHTP